MTKPLCQYFGICGGCSAQHIPYSLQLENKKNFLINSIKEKDISVFFGDEYHYRNRMDFLFYPGGIGFRKKGDGNKIIDIENCVISDKRLNEFILELREFFNKCDCFNFKKHTGTFKYAVIRTPRDDSAILFVLNPESSKLAAAIEKIRIFAKRTTANNVVVTYTSPETDMFDPGDTFAVKGTEFLKENYLGRKFLFPAQGFFQNNTVIAEKMQEYCNKLLERHDTKDAHLLDLYAGVGTFGIINAGLFRDVTIIESVKPCIDAANINIKNNNITNAKAVVLDAKQLKKIKFENPLFVITDPPRSGMHQKTIEQLNVLKPDVIIYISCNVNQLRKDLLKFNRYKIKSDALFDLFPQTTHIESVVELVLKNN